MVFDFSTLDINTEAQNIQNFDLSNYVDMKQMNELVNAANEYIKCGPKCQKERKIGLLKKEYEDLQRQDANYDDKLAKAKKAYYVAAFGDAAFRKVAEKEIDESAKRSAGEMNEEIDEKLLGLETAFSNMERAKLNRELTKELIEKLEKENEQMEKVIEKQENKTAINQRLAVYEYEHLTTVDYFNLLMNKLLIVAFVIYFVLFFYYGLGYSRFNIGVLVVLAILVFYNYFYNYGFM